MARIVRGNKLGHRRVDRGFLALLERGLRAALEASRWRGTLVRARRLEDAALLGAAHAATPPSARPARPLHMLTVAEARTAQAAEVPAPAGEHELETVELDGPVPTLLYRPPADAPMPLCVWFPGGGWVLDTVAVSEPACRRIAAETPCGVALVRYRLAPEHRFPAQLEDCLAALRWLVDIAGVLGLDRRRVAVGVTSAGANPASPASLAMRPEGGIRLAPGSRDPRLYARCPRPVEPGEDGFGFTRRDADWCWSHYLAQPAAGRTRSPRRFSPRISPVSLARSWSRRSSTHCAARRCGTQTDSRAPAFRSGSRASTMSHTASSPTEGALPTRPSGLRSRC